MQKRRSEEAPLEAAEVSKSFDGIMCDLDGVTYRGDRVIPGAPEAIARLEERGVHVVFCTNNSRLTLAQYTDKLTGMGIEVRADDLVTSPVVTAEVLAERGYEGSTAMVVGDAGINESLDAIGVHIEDGAAAAVDLVIVGWDIAFDYEKMRRAATAVRNGATFVATNSDATFPAPAELLPGAGAILASIEVAAGRRAEVMGKPHRPMLEAVARRLTGAHSIAAVGDRPDSDLAGGASMGWATILVLSGVTNEQEAAELDPRPDLIAASIAELG